VLRQINAVLNSIDRLEVRGRDSAGISIMFLMPETAFDRLVQELTRQDLLASFEKRMQREVLNNASISCNRSTGSDGQPIVAVTAVYKIAAEIGSLGDNIRFLREQIRQDSVLQIIAASPHRFHTVSSHTRWASVGAITEPNCHPADNAVMGTTLKDRPIIHACLNGDIDNYLELKSAMEVRTHHSRTDHHRHQSHPAADRALYEQGNDIVTEAFRLGGKRFPGLPRHLHAHRFGPGKVLPGPKGQRPGRFRGAGPGPLYACLRGLWLHRRDISHFLKMNGEQVVDRQIRAIPRDKYSYWISRSAGGDWPASNAMYYDGTPIHSPTRMSSTPKSPRGISIGRIPPLFSKGDFRSAPVGRTHPAQSLEDDRRSGGQHYVIHLDERMFPPSLIAALAEDRIRRVFFVGQAPQASPPRPAPTYLKSYLADPTIQLRALKASELSGFELSEGDSAQSMADTLVVAISQSGTTTDTNRTVDMVKARGAHTLAIVNRRDSDITFKVDGVLYTSSGRDIEMSVASTKAFYSQIVAGALLGLKVASIKGRRSIEFLSDQIAELLQIPRTHAHRAGHGRANSGVGPAAGGHQDLLGCRGQRPQQVLGG
jgi:glucosamine--fructose-6-phosphate aminotransferase (isomerizing)